MYIILSPHFDDAPFSCGGIIHTLTAAGQQVEVRTIFGSIPTPDNVPDTPITRDLHQRWAAGADPVAVRAAEDEAAILQLGASYRRMAAYADCVYRCSRSGLALYPNEESLFGEVHPDDMAARLLPTVALPPEPFVAEVYAPLAAGHHVDHQIVRDWGFNLWQYRSALIVKFYEDYPYTRDEAAVEAALRAFAPLSLRPEITELSEEAVIAKLNAIRCYRSQMSTFWPDDATMEAETRAMLNAVGGGRPAERCWVPG